MALCQPGLCTTAVTVHVVTAESQLNLPPVAGSCFHTAVLTSPFLPLVLWNVYGDCDNFATLKGHSGAVMELHYNTDGRCGLRGCPSALGPARSAGRSFRSPSGLAAPAHSTHGSTWAAAVPDNERCLLGVKKKDLESPLTHQRP